MARTSVNVWIHFICCVYLSCIDCIPTYANAPGAQVMSVKISSTKDSDNEVPINAAQLILLGKNLNGLQGALTFNPGRFGQGCPKDSLLEFPLSPRKVTRHGNLWELFLPVPEELLIHMSKYEKLWICSKSPALQSGWTHQGNGSAVLLVDYKFEDRRLHRRSLTNKNQDAEEALNTSLLPSSSASISDVSPTVNSETTPGKNTPTEGLRTSGPNISERDKNKHDDRALQAEPSYSASNKNMDGMDVFISGFRVESHSKGLEYDIHSAVLLAGDEAKIRFYGQGLNNEVRIQFTANKQDKGSTCHVKTTGLFKFDVTAESWATATIKLPPMGYDQNRWYLCVRVSESDLSVHQGSDDWLTLVTFTLPIPLWLQVLFLSVLLCLSGLFSGLNLGLMALDKTELKIISNTGTANERDWAQSIVPVRKHGNFLLCTLLLGNVLVNSTLTILLDNLSSGLVAVIVSTIAIVIFGEIVPQAICSRYGLAIGAKTVYLVYIFMGITGIVSYPISKILDCLLGEEIGYTYGRDRLKELIRVQDQNDIRQEEQNIICGALELHRKTVAEVMTKIEDVYMLSTDTILDFNTIDEIMQQGYSRVPIYEQERHNIVGVLFAKELAFIDPDMKTTIKTHQQYYDNPWSFVFEDTTLDVMFKDFKVGSKGHMAFVQRINSEGEGDPFYEVVGLVTLEDVIEELIQEEIVDETDVFTDNRTKRRRQNRRKGFKEFHRTDHSTKKIQISPQLQVAVLQFLRTSVEPFKEGNLSEDILRRMLNQDIIHVAKSPCKTVDPSEAIIYVQGKSVDYFVLILEGTVIVTIGRENLTFETGPFSYFGISVLTINQSIGESPSQTGYLSRASIHSLESLNKNSFTPDYGVRASSDHVTFLKIRRSHYLAARRAYLVQQSQKDGLPDDQFEKEMAKMLLDELTASPLDESANIDLKESLLNGRVLPSNNNDEPAVNFRRSFRRSKKQNRSSGSKPSTPTKERYCSDSSQSDPSTPLTPKGASDC